MILFDVIKGVERQVSGEFRFKSSPYLIWVDLDTNYYWTKFFFFIIYFHHRFYHAYNASQDFNLDQNI
jgi:hypothetical protein